MHDRTSTPDILGSIMSGLENAKAIKKENIKTIKQAKEPEKEKATFNLPITLLSELEDKCHRLRKMCKSKQVSKTLLVEEALKMAFVDFDIKGEAGTFFHQISKSGAVKQ